MTALRRIRPSRALAFLALAALPFGSCDESGSPSGPREGLFVIRVCRDAERPAGELFRVLVLDPAERAEAERLIGAGEERIVTGRVVRGSGGFNAPWSWHLDPASVRFADAAIEVCDACPSYLEENLDDWIERVGSYCPWSTAVIGRG